MNEVQLLQENRLLKERIALFKTKRQQLPEMHKTLDEYVVKFKKTITQMTQQFLIEQQESNIKLHEITQKYQHVLKEQIGLLQQNKHLSERRQNQESKLNNQADKLASEYERQIAQFENKVKKNVKKIKEMSGTNIIKKIVKNKRFQSAMKQRGCNLEGLLKQTELEQVAEEVEQIEQKIENAELKSSDLDEELQKMSDLIETMRDLMENMQKEKHNILRQNVILKEKIDQSEQLIGKFSLSSVNECPKQQEEERENGLENKPEDRQEEKKNSN